MSVLKNKIVLVPAQVLISRKISLNDKIVSVHQKTNTNQIYYINLNTNLIMVKYLFPDNQKKFTYQGADTKIIGQQFTITDIKKLLDDYKNSPKFYHYLPFNFVTRNRKTIDAVGWNEKINKQGFILKAGIKFYDNNQNNYIEVESYYSGSFNPPKGSVSQKETFWDGAKREIREELKILIKGKCPKKNSHFLITIYNQKYNKNLKFRAIFMGYENDIRKKTKIRYFKIRLLGYKIIDRIIIPLIKQNIQNFSTEITQIRKRIS